jgi:hypothetical protein
VCVVPEGDRSRCETLGWAVLSSIHDKLNSVALVHERAVPTVRLPLVGEVSAKVCG